jgi:hypothetical protein
VLLLLLCESCGCNRVGALRIWFSPACDLTYGDILARKELYLTNDVSVTAAQAGAEVAAVVELKLQELQMLQQQQELTP